VALPQQPPRRHGENQGTTSSSEFRSVLKPKIAFSVTEPALGEAKGVSVVDFGFEMATPTKFSTVRDIFLQRCPRCRLGNIFRYSIFRGFPKMHERCPICDLKFEREPGYFLGAMYVSYGLGIVMVALIAALLWWLTGWWITKDTIWAVVLFLPLAPTITLFARVLWIYLDQTIDPEQRP
jgi:uncharacterized protein (DUF983 family)